MPRKCVICDHVQNNDISLYKLPSKEETRKAWIDFIKFKKGSFWKPEKSVFICKRHFDMSSYRTPVLANPDRILLKVDAVPSILDIETYNTDCNNEQYSEEQPICKKPIEERSKIIKESNVLKAELRNLLTKMVQVECIASINSQSRGNNEQFQTRQESSFGNSISENEYEEQVHNIPQEIPITRKRKQGHSICEKRPRIRKPRFVGDIKLSDFTSLERAKQHWEIALKSIENLRKQNKMLRKKCQRYKTKITDFNSLLAHLEQDKLISKDVGQIINVRIYANRT